MSVRDLPKVELHLHLEGAAPPAFIRGFARERHVDIEGLFDERGHYRFDGFTGFLKAYEAATSALLSPGDHARLLRAVLEASAEQGVIYTELFLSPDLCGGGDLSAWRDYVAAFTEVAESMAGDIACRGIVTCIRHLGPERARRTALCAAETMGGFITGLGLAGDERVGAPKDYAWAFDLGREAGLGLTAHAGEFGGPASVRETLRDLRVNRIGHGVRAIEDLALVDDLAERGVVLECCPGANIALGLYPGWRQHPVGELYRRGVKVTLSTDDPAFFRTGMVREYERLHDAFDWDEGVFRDMARTALAAAFCDEASRARLMKRLEDA